MFRLQFIGIVLLVAIDLHYYCSTESVLSSIVDFLELHLSYCTSSQLCSIRNNSSKSETCCQTCTCENECETDDTCCPDFLLHKALGNVTFGNARSLRENVQHLNDTAIVGFSKDFQVFVYNDTYKCVDYKLRSGTVAFDTPKKRKAYEMIALCPNRYLAHTNIKILCEVSVDEYRKNMGYFNGSNLEELVNIFTPVTSLKTNITYRNMYCLECSGENISDNVFISWTAFFTCNGFWTPLVSRYTIKKDNPYELFDLIFKTEDRDNRCNIIMKPSKIIEHLTPKKCSRSDITTCPLGSDKRLDLLCQSINLPVKQHEGLPSTDINIYRNIACYVCTKNKSFVEQCEGTAGDKWVFEIALNFISTRGLFPAYLLPNTSNDDTGKSMNSSDSIIIANAVNSSYTLENNTTGQKIVAISKLEDMKKLASLYCNNNSELKTCGEILCPQFFYQSHGECIPTFASFGGMYFGICLEIKTAESQQLKIVLPAFIQNLENIGKSFFSNYSFDIWSSLDNKEPTIIVAIINITSTDSDYLSTLNKIDHFLRNMNDIRFQTEQGMVDISIKLCDKLSYQFIGVDKYPNNRRIILEVYRRGTQLAMPLVEIEILQQMGCYHIAVESDDRGYFYDSGFKVDLLSSRSENSTEFYKFSFCLADALPLGVNRTDAYMFKGFAGKTLNPQIQEQETIFRNNSVNPKLEEIFIKNNVSRNDTDTNERIEDPVSPFSFGVREGCLIVFAVVTLVVILVTIVMYKKRVTDNSNVEGNNIELENGPKDLRYIAMTT